MPSRRQTAATVAGLFAVKAVSGQNDPAYSSGALGAGPFSTFVSSNATPPVWNHVLPINETTKPRLSSGLIFVGPRGTDTHQAGPYIYNQTGEVVWDGGLDGYTQTMAYSVQQYQNKPVLAIWQGQFNAGGYGFGYNLLLNQSYQVVGNVTTDLNGLGADIHDFQITANDTALLTAYNSTQLDLTPYGGPSDGHILTGIFQEVNISSGASMFIWNSLDHVDPSECYVNNGSTGTEASPWDYLHINSVEKDNSGNYLVSSRHCHAAYYIDGINGDILWTLGGKNSSFTGNGSEFYYQHDARFHSTNNSQISIFDNGAASWETSEATARGLLIDLDYTNMTATLVVEAIPYYNLTVSRSQGNVEIQSNGNMLIGWGQMPWIAEHNSAGEPLWAAQIGVGDVQAYRAHRHVWNGYPKTLPSFVIQNNGSRAGYVSWNGATEVSVWELLGSNDASAVVSLANTSAIGKFETNFTISGDYSYFQVRALDSGHQPLGYSNFVSGSNGTTVQPAATQTPAVGAANATTTTSSSGSATASPSSTKSTSGATQTDRASLLAMMTVMAVACFQLV